MSESSLPVPAWFNSKAVIAEFLEGKRTEEIAVGFGVTREKLVYFLTKHSPEDWKEAQVIRAIKRKEEGEQEMDDAGDMLQLRKAEAKVKSAQWDLEKVCRRIYGETKEQFNMQPVMINIDLGRDRQPTLSPWAQTIQTAKELGAKEPETVEALAPQEPKEVEPAAIIATAPQPKKKLKVFVERTTSIDYGDGSQFV
jgi:hypothetical protein